MTERIPGFATLAIHAGAQPDPTTGARATPIYQTTSFVFDDVDHAASLFGLQAFGNIYTRIGNPTNAVLEERVAALEGGTAGLAVASGHAAQVLVFHCLMKPGDEFVAVAQALWRLDQPVQPLVQEFRLERGVGRPRRHRLVRARGVAEDQGDLHRVDRQSRRRHHRHRGGRRRSRTRAGVPLIVDNTLATPYLCRPIEYGADIVVHSLTKFLGGHGNSIGGMIVDGGTFNWSREGRYPMLSEPRPEYHGIVLHETFGNFAFAIACRVLGLRDIGPALSPFNAFLILTGIETLAAAHAAALRQRAGGGASGWRSIRAWPGSAIRAWPATATTTSPRNTCPKGAGAVFTFGLKGGYDAGVKLVSNVKLFSHLANIGDTRSLIIHPASTTHRQLSDAQKVQAGAGPDVVRLSIGLEDTADIIADLEQALSAGIAHASADALVSRCKPAGANHENRSTCISRGAYTRRHPAAMTATASRPTSRSPPPRPAAASRSSATTPRPSSTRPTRRCWSRPRTPRAAPRTSACSNEGKVDIALVAGEPAYEAFQGIGQRARPRRW